jgi:cytochrome c oxidase assembly protein subunit 15
VNAIYRTLVWATTVLAFVVVVVGAFVRLSDAGLGCPDWPGCYGQLTPALAQQQIERAVESQGGDHGPVSLPKAWKEMVHRYLAGTLGLLILAIAAIGWRGRARLAQSPLLPLGLLALVVFQAALGMWTVTLLLKPVIVTLHLLGGMATLALLAWLGLRQKKGSTPIFDNVKSGQGPHFRADLTQSAPGPLSSRRTLPLRPWAAVGLAIVIAQIALGGWVAANYAALACIDFPTCHGKWMPDMDFAHAFQLVRELGRTADGGHLAYEALTAIHWTHRAGALLTLVYLGVLAIALLRAGPFARHGSALAVMLLIQIALGIANVVAGLPLAVAVMHNAAAALLLLVLVVINFDLSRSPSAPL